MTPANRSRICTAALYSVPGVCRCPVCNPEPPAEGATTAAPKATAARLTGPFPSGGGTTDPRSGGAYPAPEPTAAARPLDRRECSPGDGLFGGECDA